MRILITGNKGYIGSVLSEVLIERGYDIVGLDTDYYTDCDIFKNTHTFLQLNKDIRNITLKDVKGFDVIIHLAALSNDPLGEFDPLLTEEINLHGTIKTAQFAKEAGVKRFIYSSSQSMYGISTVDGELEEDTSEKNPLTAYARTKWESECKLKTLSNNKFHVVCFRPSTVFGLSSRLRCDIVFNNLVACAFTTGKIEIKSDGTPWRPVVHVRDVSDAFIAGIEAPLELVSNQSFNVGIPNGNFTVRQLAEAAQKAIPGSILTFTGEHGNDSRTYKVSFNKILNTLKDYYKPKWGLKEGAEELVRAFNKINFNESQFRGRCCIRLKQLKYLIETGKINHKLFWI